MAPTRQRNLEDAGQERIRPQISILVYTPWGIYLPSEICTCMVYVDHVQVDHEVGIGDLSD